MREGAAGGGDPVNLSVNGQSQVPPGFRFHPTEEELLHYYLRKKVASDQIDLDVIREVDLNKLEPWERCKIGSTPQNDWYFFSHKDKKYPTGTRTNRATAAGFWKATGRDKIIYSSYKRIGLRKTLVFYKGRAPHGQKSDWIMHEYRLDDAASPDTTTTLITSSPGLSNYILGGDQGGSEEGWVVCRVFRKKNYQKSLESPRSGSSTNNSILHHHHNPGDSKSHIIVTSSPAASYLRGTTTTTVASGDDDNGVLDQILLYMGKQQQQRDTDCKAEINYDNSFGMRANEHLQDRFIHLPRLVADHENQHHQQQQQQDNCFSTTTSSIGYQQQSFGEEAMVTVTTENNNIINIHNNNNHKYFNMNNNEASCTNQGTGFDVTASGNDNRPGGGGGVINDWVALDRLVASQLNGHLDDEVDLLNDDGDDDMIDDHDDTTGGAHPHHHHHDNKAARHHHHHPMCHGGGSIDDGNDLWTSFTTNTTKSASSPSSSSHPLCHLSV
ncbi:unnamed protein product [Linum tenue]|uniref:NAC domain-containing protein n=1 Tax=Linum tenue TaxID=586396 RepID=A0AAV0JIT5_9ROSI|nr:unnamed protein product [Linum tenue]